MWDSVRRRAYQLLIVLLGIVLCIELATWPISYAGRYWISFCTQRRYFGLEISKGTSCLTEQAASPDDLDGFAPGWDFESSKPRDIGYSETASEPRIARLPGITLSEGWSLGPSDHYYEIYISQLPFVFLTISVLGFLLMPALRRRRLRKREALGHCQSCGYDLRAHIPGSNCPECGTPIPEKVLLQ